MKEVYDMYDINVLIACEESQRVCKAFRDRGFNAFSCDIIDCSGDIPQYHIKDDVLNIIYGGSFTTSTGDLYNIPVWDLIIAHPPCTYLAVSGNAHFNVERYGEKAIKRYQDRQKAIAFFMAFLQGNTIHLAIENPIGCMSTIYKKPDQIIQPYEYGHPVRKSTCLWLHNLPLLKPSKIVKPEIMHSKGKSGGYSGPAWIVRDENGKILKYSDPRVKKERSKTYQGIAAAMAKQWGDYLLREKGLIL